MQTIWIRYKKMFAIALALVITYAILRLRKYEYSASVTIPKTHASDVWEFVADFSNMKYLNPTIINFNVVSESGNYEHWKYTVEYSENLSHWPYNSNFAIAHFDVKSLRKQETYYIFSSHNTCLFGGLFCLASDSEFKFTGRAYDGGAVCEEHLEYECPLLLSLFCKREVAFQRNAIMHNLRKHFIH